ncbi:MAG: electron transporter RnfD [Gammaproteobacteria bacterium RIFOXYA12_FULL_61_12]|nr:MAG: electron transporter RnfD [Gammaproteobacteria bacterium RIFOXYD12_FULL_61_37]OGT93558.1 MAG: electron transporter RnfD [Gammaproteobacteria bacterium RIFOXYA12_FULL_61_12]
MRSKDPKLLLQPAPILRQGMTTPTAMRDVLLALMPALAAGAWFFGLGALLVVAASIAGALAIEWAFTPPERRAQAIGDNSALLTGLLLGMTLPPALPMWMAFIGGMTAIGLGKIIWGGLGTNLFNPALLGRAFLLGTFPIAMTTWTDPGAAFFHIPSSVLAWPFQSPVYDAVAGATPLGLMKFEYKGSDFLNLLIGNTGGSLGETSGLLLILGGLYLWWRRDLDWRIPAAIILAAVLFSGILYAVNPGKFPGPLFTLFAGGFWLGTLFMATDPVTSPLTPRGAWIFGLGIGFLVVLIRVFGGFPEGMMYAILLMNAATPLIDRYTQPRVFGRGREGKAP